LSKKEAERNGGREKAKRTRRLLPPHSSLIAPRLAGDAWFAHRLMRAQDSAALGQPAFGDLESRPAGR